jgi:hypothetical protein
MSHAIPIETITLVLITSQIAKGALTMPAVVGRIIRIRLIRAFDTADQQFWNILFALFVMNSLQRVGLIRRIA